MSYIIDMISVIFKSTKINKRRFSIQLLTILMLFLYSISFNSLHANNSLSSEQELPPITITTNEDALQHLQKAHLLIALGKYKKSITYINAISEAYT